MKRILLLNAILAFAFIACAPTQPRLVLSDPSAVSGAVYVEYDEFKKNTLFQGPYIQPNSQDTHLIRVYVQDDESVAPTYQIYVKTRYWTDEWRFYDRGFGIDGTPLEFALVDRDFTSSSYTEQFVFNVSREYLEKFKDNPSGLKIKYTCNDPSYDKIITIPGGYIQGFLNRVSMGR